MGEGDGDSTGEALSRRPWPEPKAGHSPVAAGLRGSRSRAEHKAPAGRPASERLSSAPAPTLPETGGAAPSSCQAEAGEAEPRTPPSPRRPAPVPPGRPGRRFCCLP